LRGEMLVVHNWLYIATGCIYFCDENALARHATGPHLQPVV
jgi:hypothetical protein